MAKSIDSLLQVLIGPDGRAIIDLEHIIRLMKLKKSEMHSPQECLDLARKIESQDKADLLVRGVIFDEAVGLKHFLQTERCTALQDLNGIFLCHVTNYFPDAGEIHQRANLNLKGERPLEKRQMDSLRALLRPTVHFCINHVVRAHNEHPGYKQPILIIDPHIIEIFIKLLVDIFKMYFLLVHLSYLMRL